jgi:regulator of sigma E protease
LIVCAGPAANLLLAIALYWLLFMQGVAGVRPIVGEVADNSLAAQASLKKGALIQKIAGEPIKSWQEARWILLEKSLAGKPVELESIRDNELHSHTLSFAGINSDPEIDVLKKIGIAEFEPVLPATIDAISPSSAAEKAGFQPKDTILSIDKNPIQHWDEMVSTIKTNPEKALTFEVMRQQKVINIIATPEAVKDNDQTIGRLGASAKPSQADIDKLLIEQHYSPTQSLSQAVKKTWSTSTFSLKMLWQMLMGKVSVKSLSGPVSIATYAGESANLGIKPFLEFLALVSISIGVLNLLPIPVLDGGHLMYYIVEIVKGSPVSTKAMLAGQKIGFGLLGLLMTIAIFNDFNRLIAG